jgi:LysM repeat protein
MMKMKWMMAIATFSAVFCAANTVNAQDEFIEYKVQPGDTCIGIARKVYGDGQLCYQLIDNYNDFDSRFRIYPGQVLKLPTKEKLVASKKSAGADARINSHRGAVRTRAPKVSSWREAERGQDLFRAWRVDSGEKSSAEIRFLREKANLRMRENTLVVIYGEVEREAGGHHASLERGTLATRLDELAGATVEVETPSAVAVSEDGQGLVKVLDGGTTLVANHTSKKARVRSRRKGGAEIALPENTGSKVVKGKDPTPPKPLPAPPKWVEDKITAFSVLGDNRAVLEWGEVPGAAAWRIEVFDSSQDLVNAFVVSDHVRALELARLPAGVYSVTISTTDDEGFEGKPSPSAAVEIIDVVAEEMPFTSSKITPGTELSFGYLSCRFSGEEAYSRRLLAVEPGKKTIECKDGERELDPVEIEVTSVSAQTPKRLVLEHGESYAFDVLLDVPVRALEVRTTGGLEATGEPTSKNGTNWVIPVRNTGKARSSASVSIAGTDIVVARVVVDTRKEGGEQLTASARTQEPLDVSLRLSGLGSWRGLFGESLDLQSGDVSLAWNAGLQGSALIEQHLLFDLSLEVGRGADVAGNGLTTVGGRLGLGYLFSTRNLRPFVSLGGGPEHVVGEDSATLPVFHVGAGLLWSPQNRRFGARLDLRENLVAGRLVTDQRLYSQAGASLWLSF